MRGHTVRGHVELAREVLARIPARGMVMPDAAVIKDSRDARIWEQRIDFGAEPQTIIVKQKKRTGAREILRTFLRRVGAVAAWRWLRVNYRRLVVPIASA